MTCNYNITVKFLHLVNKMIKLHAAVAFYAWIGCPARFVFLNEGFYDFLFKKLLIMNDIVGNIHGVCNTLCIFNALE